MDESLCCAVAAWRRRYGQLAAARSAEAGDEDGDAADRLGDFSDEDLDGMSLQSVDPDDAPQYMDGAQVGTK